MTAVHPTTLHQQTALRDVINERIRQDQKWGVQSHPDICPCCTKRQYTPEETAGIMGVPTAKAARELCEGAADSGNLSWSHILNEEHSEVVEAAAQGNAEALKLELTQVAAVALAWLEDIARKEQEG